MSASVRRIRPGEGSQLRQARLRLLGEAPWRQGLLEEERRWPSARWVERAQHGSSGDDLATFVAEDEEEWQGVVDALRDDAGVVELAGLWVEPIRRRAGIGRALVGAVVAWAEAQGARRVGLWVVADNGPAVRLFLASGFRQQGESLVISSDPSRLQLRLVRELT